MHTTLFVFSATSDMSHMHPFFSLGGGVGGVRDYSRPMRNDLFLRYPVKCLSLARPTNCSHKTQHKLTTLCLTTLTGWRYRFRKDLREGRGQEGRGGEGRRG